MEDESKNHPQKNLGRRDLLRKGAGATVGAVLGLGATSAMAQLTTDGAPTALPPWGSLPTPANNATHRVSSAGYVNSSTRAFGVAEMDDITRYVIDYANKFWAQPLSPSVTAAANEAMLDSMGAIIGAFDSDPVRSAARVVNRVRGVDGFEATVLGYGFKTAPAYATFANCTMVRHLDFSDNGLHGTHYSDVVPAIIAIAEAYHYDGIAVLKAVTLAYELIGEFQSVPTSQGRAWDTIYVGPSACIAIGKMMGLTDDQLANAYSLSLVTHMEYNASHSSGPLSMLKAGHNADTVMGAVFSALLAQEGMTGPPAPFAGTKGLFDAVSGGPFKIVLPKPYEERDYDRKPGQMVIEGMEVKRFPSEGGSQQFLRNIPKFREFAKTDDIATIRVKMNSFGEIGDPAKWDPRNEETADHSVAYLIARGLLDGDIYMSSFARAKFMDPKARALMAVTTITEEPGLEDSPVITVNRKDGQSLTLVSPKPLRMTHEEVIAKFNRICDYKQVDPAQRDRIRATWDHLDQVKDMAIAVKLAAVYGHHRPLTDKAPTN